MSKDLAEEINLLDYKDEIRIGIVGNIDAGKSTFVGVITNKVLDNGRGSARSLVMKHPHEKETGRTSDIAIHYLRYPNKVIEMIDLAGHERYLKTTIRGIHGNKIDYAGIIINANSGIQIMTREHFSIVYTLKIPIFIIYSKIDIAPSNIYDINLKYIQSFLGKQVKLESKVIEKLEDLNEIYEGYDKFTSEHNFLENIIVPIFPMSSVTGKGVDLVHNFLENIPQHRNYRALCSETTNFVINSVYHVAGIGLVVSGLLISGTVNKGDILSIGPIYHYHSGYLKICVKNIHNNFRESVATLYAGQNGCFNIKPLGHVVLKKNMIKTGMRILSPQKAESISVFEARVKILHNPSTITYKYQPVIHCGGISQSAKILKMNKDYLRSNDDAVITFKFMFHPEYVEEGCVFVFRDGLTKGIGKITQIFTD